MTSESGIDYSFACFSRIDCYLQLCFVLSNLALLYCDNLKAAFEITISKKGN